MVDSGDSGREQLDVRPAAADGHHRLADALLLVDLLVRQRHAVGVAVEGDRLVEVAHGDPDVVDGGEELGRAVQSCSLSLRPCTGMPRHERCVTLRPRP